MQSPDAAPQIRGYLVDDISVELEASGFQCRIVENEKNESAPFLIAERRESPDHPTVLLYGHGDVVRGFAEQWRAGLDPWRLTVEGDRWYGRGAADNKGQHSINLAALKAVLDVREGRLGCNVKWIFETGEEIGSPGLKEVCQKEKRALAADLLVASDGPRLSAAQPTIFLGSRGIAYFELSVSLRKEGLHSGNWGGIKKNAATILVNALASIVDGRGRIKVEGLKPADIPADVAEALRRIEIDERHLGEAPDADWGEESKTAAERLLGWNALEILAISSGDVARPINAIPPTAVANCQLRFIVGTPWQDLGSSLRRHLDENGFGCVEVNVRRCTPATRGSPNAPWVKWAERSIRDTTGKDVVVMPNLGGTLPNDIFVDVLDLPTIWVPHSYPLCRQHAADEHLLASVAAEGLEIMAGLFWDLGEPRNPSVN